MWNEELISIQFIIQLSTFLIKRKGFCMENTLRRLEKGEMFAASFYTDPTEGYYTFVLKVLPDGKEEAYLRRQKFPADSNPPETFPAQIINYHIKEI